MSKPKNRLQWNLDHILPLNQFDSLYREIERDLRKIDGFYKKLSPQMREADFIKFIEFDEALSLKISRLYDMPHLMESVDEKSATAKLLKERAKDLYVVLAKETQKISNWLKGKVVKNKPKLDDKNAKRLFKSVPDLEYVLTFTRESAKHTLSEEVENIIIDKTSTGESVLTDLRELIETELVFQFKPSKNEKAQPKTHAELISYVRNPKPGIRRAAYEAMFPEYLKNLDKFFMIYQAIAKSWISNAKIRGYESPIAMRNHKNHISDKSIETLLSVSRRNIHIFQKYFNLKARDLKLKKLTRFDIYAPLDKATAKMPIHDAVSLVLETFEEFSPRFGEYARRIVNENHIDYLPSPVKRGGAFCATIGPTITPYVLLNYDGTARDVSTLAHELGHGVHSLYASNHSISSQHANLPLAETASTLGELILFEKLLARCKSREERKIMLSEKISDAYATIIRQNYFVKFEIDAYKAMEKGVTAEGLSEIYMKGLKEQFGNTVEIDPRFKYEWATIPHIVNSPFYCYSYNFGELLSLALFKKYKEEGQTFVPKIEKILEYGGSKNPTEVLREVGINIESPAFWQDSFEIIKEWQKELENLSA